ncbi:MAG: translocation/assembly module TamB, partial [Muribaculaceae bacterium]|nr:translocation/assembly module TamB [Muribaculaceae bacterium]
DTTQMAAADTVVSPLSMRIVAGLTIQPGTQVEVNIPGTATTGNGKVEISPSGTLNYFQNYMGDMRLNGQLNIGNGYAKYAVPVVGEKKFTFDPESYVQWSGDIMNPRLNIDATDMIKTNLIENGNSRLVNFLVNLSVGNTLSAPKILFDLSTDDDLSIQNELMSMSADQRSMAAINLLLTGQYSGQGVKTASSDMLQGALYGMLTSQLNNWMANHVKGVDLSFGVNQYDKTVNGETGSTTSYSYQMSKSLFNNRFKISVGGNYSTDASADENFSENLISDISFEYILKQTNSLTMYARLFRHTGYESILEGEITETGVGFVMKRRLATLRRLFRLGRRKNNNSDDSHKPDSLLMPHNSDASVTTKDSIAVKPKDDDTDK